jgi:hypothetical protein
MFPGVSGFQWDFGHVLFLALFFGVVSVVLTTFGVAAWRAFRDVRSKRVEKVRWGAEFEELAPRDRRCRHELAGQVRQRVCPNGFDCRECTEHPRFAALPAVERSGDILGLEYPADRLYHRGHAWVRPEGDGTFAVGLDELGKRLIGRPDEVELPRKGERIETNGTGWRMSKNGVDVRVLAPVDGEVIETGGPDRDFYLRVRAVESPVNLRHLLGGAELRPWLMAEIERLERQFAPAATGPTLADGGVLIDGIMDAAPGEDWDRVTGSVFLES